MTKPKILVTSATGHTGRAAVMQLLVKGFPVRAFVHRRDTRSQALEQAGAEIAVGDLFDLRDLRRAMVGVERAYQKERAESAPPDGSATKFHLDTNSAA